MLAFSLLTLLTLPPMPDSYVYRPRRGDPGGFGHKVHLERKVDDTDVIALNKNGDF